MLIFWPIFYVCIGGALNCFIYEIFYFPFSCYTISITLKLFKTSFSLSVKYSEVHLPYRSP